MENNHDIDKKFNEASKVEEPMTFPGFDKVWAQVEEKLDIKENKKRIIPIWLPYGIAVSLIIGLGAFYFINKNDDSAIKKTAIAQHTVYPKVNSSVQAIDSTVKSNIEKEIAVAKSSVEKPSTLVFDDKIPEPVKKVNEIYTTDQYYIKKKDNQQSEKEKYEGTDGDGVLDKEDKETSIEGVVVTGYRTVKKQSYTSSATSIASTEIVSNKRSKKYKENITSSPSIALNYVQGQTNDGYISNSPNVRTEFIEKRPNANIMNIVQGQLAGVNINTGSGQPGSKPTVLIRGIGSLNGNAQPLYVINGKVSDAKEFGKLNPNTVESINVLKDASATSLYGSRASNGVVVITTKKLSRKQRKAYEKLQKVQDSIKKAKFIEKQNNEEYDAFIENPFELTKNQSVSTFSIDVDNAAYSNIRRMINNGEMVDKNAVRIEEMINYFKYSYPQPKNDQPFSINTEYGDSPWNTKYKLLKIGLQGKSIPANQLPASNFVFLIDVSGSMDAPNKLPLLKSSFKVLLDQLRSEDKVGIVVYAGSAGMVLSPTSAREKNKIIEALDNLQAGGSTAGGEGIELAYKLAQENFIKGGNNRVIIATDGDFNVGASSTGDLQTLVEEKRKSGVFLTCLGFGMGNFKDNRMETLADKGNGNYAYIDNMQEANKFLGKEFAGSMYAIAKDVKIQIEFNPQFVKSYRLIGYENRKLKNEDFTNDAIDAGELGSGHTVTALYEIIPNDVQSDFLPKETELKYTHQTSDSNFGNELATVKFRYKKPDGDKSTEITQVVQKSDISISGASEDFKFASSVAWFGLILRNSKFIQNKDLKEVENLAKKGRGKDDEGYRAEFVRLVESYKTQQ
ncbi:MAG: von Willebrand factor type A domain-containing protein [Candidatus Chryseobacterium colombiense]|nr:von Willebrand factor type A domain-containing protein [Chryseobacterium sp.]WEK71364.1 MAG: von Willebrand factor type A domain-containing protein [Chryseobacterium sp.]